ncbi:MAG: DUF4982 domain-containing protein [Lachnospiraceae bacterium]|nr:DUF4982 domain-containing protein [Lachnospiraceae bacterium]
MRYLFNKGWRFLETKVGTPLEEAMERDAEFKPVQLPHDWLIYDSTDLYRDGTGWYIRDLALDEVKGRYFLEFDAVYMDSAVYVNGVKVCEWKYGYSAFGCEITEYVHEGTNRIAVSATYRSPNTRWYSGAGIYRNVYIRQTGDTYIARDGVYVSNRLENGKRILHIETEVLGSNASDAVITYTVTDQNGEETELIKISDTDYEIVNPHLWDINDAYLYLLKTVMTAPGKNGEDTDESVVRFGIRDILFDPDKGFLLNGKRVKLNGVCEHHDLGSLGAAFNTSAMRRKFVLLKKMGVNALRTSHNMPAPEVLDLCDEMGILVMTENFDMWYRPKTEYDYARFFADWHERDMESWVKQDRDHPSVIMWSIGNEIYDAHADESAPDTVRHLMDVVYRYDPCKNAVCTFASNYLPWEGAQKCGDVLKLVGYNYSERIYKKHHEKYPDWTIYGSETASLVQSRGVYKFPLDVTKLTDVDEQCSSLGNCNTSWGANSIESCICDDRDMEFSAGQFLWTGFDYIGEPTPYHTKNSYFGMLDTAGFAKDYYHVFKSAWTDLKDDPFVYIFPYWDFNPGQIIDIRVCSNADEVELFLNGKSLGKQNLTHKPGSGDHIITNYKAPYERGVLKAVAYDNGKIVAECEERSFGDSVSLKMDITYGSLTAGSEDLVFAEITALDKDGNPVKNACDRVFVEVTGAGRLVGLDNGDSTDTDSYKAMSRRMFNGKLLAVIAAGENPGKVHIKVSAKGLNDCEAEIECMQGVDTKDSPFDKGAEYVYESCGDRKINLGTDSDIPVRKLEIICDERKLTPDKQEVKAVVKIYPENATDKDIEYAIVSDKGVPLNIAEVNGCGSEALIKALGDGSFRLRAMSKSGSSSVRVISELEFSVEGVGTKFADPYGFIYGSSYSYFEGGVGTGNEMGFSSSKGERSLIAFDKIDFGQAGSDEITIPIFALDSDEHPFKIYDGIPSKGGKLIADLLYQKPMIWNVYQEDTWKIGTVLKGVHTLAFEFYDKVHVKGFSFTKYERAFMNLNASDADEIYGDDYKINAPCVEGIGNNVTINFSGMDFGEGGTSKVTICGRAPKGTNTIHVRFFDDSGHESRNVIEFTQSDDYTERTFDIDKETGMKNVSFVFMPGSCFDMRSFRFE